MENKKFNAGDKVVLITNSQIVYIFIDYEGDSKAKCLDPNAKEIILPLIAIKLYTAPPFAGGAY